MIALISNENDVQAEKMVLDSAVTETGKEDSFSPLKIVDVIIVMNSKVKANSKKRRTAKDNCAALIYTTNLVFDIISLS